MTLHSAVLVSLVQWLVTINALSGYVGQDRVTPLVSLRTHSASPEHTPPAAAVAELPSPKTSRSISEASEQHSLAAAEAGSLDDEGGLAAVASRASLSEKALGFLGGFLKGTGTTSANKVCRASSLCDSRFIFYCY